MVRDKIQTSQLINRLQDHGLGKIELTQVQVRSIEILLNKTLPNMKPADTEGNQDNELVIRWAK